MKKLLEVKDLRISFNSMNVVQGIEFEVKAGEKLALVGESGSGKTVSALSLLSLVEGAQVSGQVLLDGRELLRMNARELRAVRGDEVAVIFQEPMTALNPVYPIGDQVAEVLQLKRGMGLQEAREEVLRLLEMTGIADPRRRVDAYPHQLSGGQRQRVMIAMALACRPKLLIADEPTTALDVSLRGQILELLADLQRREGMAVLLITHDLHLVRRFADRVAIMEKGCIVEQGPVGTVFSAPQHAYTRRLLGSRPLRDLQEAPAPRGAPALQARDLSVGYRIPRPGWRGWFRPGCFMAVRGVDFELSAGRTLGVVGESGSGKTTLALAALGLLPHQGLLAVDGRCWADTRRGGDEKALRRRVQVVFQDPFSSLSPRMTVEQILGEGLRVHEPGLLPGQRRERVVQGLRDVGLLQETDDPAAWLQRYPHECSGGQRQRLAIARALMVQPTLLVLDEPTSALDVTVQQQVLRLLQKLQCERGLGYLLITHDVDVIRAMAHDVLVMKDGEVVEHGPALQVLDSPRHPYTRTLVQAAGAAT